MLSLFKSSRPLLKCHCLRKCSRVQKLWSTDLAETWGGARYSKGIASLKLRVDPLL